MIYDGLHPDALDFLSTYADDEGKEPSLVNHFINRWYWSLLASHSTTSRILFMTPPNKMDLFSSLSCRHTTAMDGADAKAMT